MSARPVGCNDGLSESLATLLESGYVSERAKRTVARITLPDGRFIGLDAKQAVNAEIEPHGNYGRSRIRFTLEIEVEAQGTADEYKAAIARWLLADIESLEKQLSAAQNAAKPVEVA